MPRLFGGMAPWVTSPHWLAALESRTASSTATSSRPRWSVQRIKGYINGVEVISVEDEVFEDGAPGHWL